MRPDVRMIFFFVVISQLSTQFSKFQLDGNPYPVSCDEFWLFHFERTQLYNTKYNTVFLKYSNASPMASSLFYGTPTTSLKHYKHLSKWNCISVKGISTSTALQELHFLSLFFVSIQFPWLLSSNTTWSVSHETQSSWKKNFSSGSFIQSILRSTKKFCQFFK